MEHTKAHNRWLIGLTFLLALLLGIYPLGGVAQWLRPAFVVLLAIYWLMYLPQYFGVGVLWLVGLLQDVVEGAVLGQHALALVVVAYLCLLSLRRVRNQALWQQSFWVFVLVGIYQLFGNWVNGLTGHATPSFMFLLPALSSALIWPLLYLLLAKVSHFFRVA